MGLNLVAKVLDYIDDVIEDGRYKAAVSWGLKHDTAFATAMKQYKEANDALSITLDKVMSKSEKRAAYERAMKEF